MMAASLALSACGGGGERQDADEPEGKFPVNVVTAEFPNRQRLAKTEELLIGIENAGDKTIPNLAVTIKTDGGGGAEGAGSGNQTAFSTYEKQADLADPARPVWVLENEYPRIVGEDGPAGAAVAQTDTFAFGKLRPNQTLEAVWKVTPSRGGTYTVGYNVSAGLGGKAVAVNPDRSKVSGRFVVTISTTPPKARVNDDGQVENEGEDAGAESTEQQQRESGNGK